MARAQEAARAAAGSGGDDGSGGAPRPAGGERPGLTRSQGSRAARRFRLTFLLVLASLAAVGLDQPPVAAAVPVAPGFDLETRIDGLSLPTAVAFAPDGRVFVTEKRGTLLGYQDLDDASPTVVADLGDDIHNYEDRGLLGLEIDPDFPAEPHLYVLYTLDRDDSWNDTCPNPPGTFADGCVVDGRLSRLTVDEDNQLVEEDVLLEDVWCAQFPSHTVADLSFMDDGSLLVSAGEGADYNSVDYGQNGGGPGSPTPANPCGDPPREVGEPHTLPGAQGGALRSQALVTPEETHTYDGSILRVDPDTGEAHPSNPLVGGGDPVDDRIVAHGLRNPYAVTARPGTREVWAGDVGWGTWEELNRVVDVEDPVVENFGWPCYEGPAPQSTYAGLDLDLCDGLYDGTIPSPVTEPYFAYQHGDPPDPGNCGTDAGSSVTAVSFYDGGQYPAAYDGALFFADYVRGCIWAMPLDGSGEPDPARIETVVAGSYPVDLEPGPGGDLFYVDIVAGEIQQVSFTGAGTLPTARVEVDRDSGPVPLEVRFDGTGSTANVAGDLDHEWDLDGDGDFDDGTDPAPSHTYTEEGTVTARLRVTNDIGETATDSVDIHAGNARPEPVMDQPSAGDRWDVDQELTLAGGASDGEDGPLGPGALEWQVNLHHCYTPTDCHVHFLETLTGQATGSVVTPDHEYPSYLEVALTATDSEGLTGTASRVIEPRTIDVEVDTEPAGISVGVGSRAVVTPATHTVLAGSTLAFVAPATETVGGVEYRFDSWSDGGDRVHDVTVSGPGSYTARYVPADPDPGPDPDGVYVSDLAWSGEVNGYGPVERDAANGEQGAGDGGPLSLRGEVFAKGVGVHADSEVVVAVPEGCATFEAVVGVDDGVGANGSVTFAVVGDGVELVVTPVLEGAVSEAHPLEVDVSGVSEVALVVDRAGDDNWWDHADWADARFTGCGDPDPDPGPEDPPGGFEQPVSLPAGDRAHSVVAHDLDGDGNLDLVAAVPGDDAAAVLLGTGSGFAPAVQYPTGPGTFPKHVEVGDLTGDGLPDLVTANQDSPAGVDVTVLPGVGDGSFGAGTSYQACSRPHQTALGDLDGDGDLDVVVACWGGDVVSVLINDGTGTLGPATDVTAADAPHSLVLEDFDGDGHLDAAVAAYGDNRVALLEGAGDGSFGPPELLWPGLGPHNIVSADLDADGAVDLVATAENDDAVGVLLGHGDGSFAEAVFYDAGPAPKATAVGDLDGDGHLDLVTADSHGNYPDGSEPTSLTVLPGAGDGSFEPGFTLDNDLTPFSVTAADLHGDGGVAVVSANWHSDDLKVWRRPPP